MKKFFLIALVVIGLANPFRLIFAQEEESIDAEPGTEQVLPAFNEQAASDLQPFQEYSKARVIQIVDIKEQTLYGSTQFKQTVKVRLLSGPEKDKELEIDYHDFVDKYNNKKLSEGDKVVVAKVQVGDQIQYDIIDRYRLPNIIWLILLFIALAVALARWRGFTAFIGLAFSVFILLRLIVPEILQGNDPVLVAITGATVIAVVSLYLAHGFTQRTSLAISSTIVTLIIAGLLAIGFATVAKLFGLASEESVYVQSFLEGAINLKGLLLAGIILGTLGVLDDITVSQTESVAEISRANPELSRKELMQAGLRIGRHHIASLINTLFLIYVGASLPLFLLFVVNTKQPAWIMLNSEFITQEVVRTLVGSIALILAVPITTALAAYWFSRHKQGTAVVITETVVVTEISKDHES